jgi:hypothetical protein
MVHFEKKGEDTLGKIFMENFESGRRERSSVSSEQ